MNSTQDLGPKPKKRTIVIGIVIVLVVILSVVSIVTLSRAHKGDTNAIPLPTPIPGGFRVILSSTSIPNVTWSDFGIALGVGGDEISWTNLTTAGLTSSGQPITWHFGSAKSLGLLSVWLNVTDVTGNGNVGQGDYIDLTTGGSQFSPNETYMLAGMYEPTGQQLWLEQIEPGLYH